MGSNRKLLALVTAATAALGWSGQSAAADWVMLQGAEPPDSTHRFFGVVQASYSNYYGCKKLEGMVNPSSGSSTTAFGLLNGSYNGNCRVGPELHDKQSDFNLDNLAFGLRGNLIPAKINYFLLANAGMNSATYNPLDTVRARVVSLTDATLTFSYIPGVRVRAGLMKKPGPEEIYQAIDAMDYIWPTDFIQRVQTERFIRTNTKGTNMIPGQSDGTASFKGYDGDAGRDWGIQFFDAFKVGNWTSTYAAMIGNGSGIHDIKDYNSKKDLNLYFSSEYDLPGGKGPHKHGVKLYGYHQEGTRNFEVNTSGSLSQDFKFVRYGIGAKALGPIFGEARGKHRLGFELMYADGMVFLSPTGNVIDEAFGGQLGVAAEKGNKSRGFTLDYGYYLNDKWQFDVRYSRNDELYATIGNIYWGASDKRVIQHLTFGVNYHFSPQTRLTVNLEPRDVKAPNAVNGAINPATGAAFGPTYDARATRNANIVSDAVGARFGLQLTHMF